MILYIIKNNKNKTKTIIIILIRSSDKVTQKNVYNTLKGEMYKML